MDLLGKVKWDRLCEWTEGSCGWEQEEYHAGGKNRGRHVWNWGVLGGGGGLCGNLVQCKVPGFYDDPRKKS